MTAALVAVVEMMRLPSRVVRGLIVAMLIELMPRRGAEFWTNIGMRAVVAVSAGATIFELLVAGRY